MFVPVAERNGWLAPFGGAAMSFHVFDKRSFLDAVLAKAGSKSAMARALDLPPARVMEMFKDERRLTMEEGMVLAERFGVHPMPGVSAEQLVPVLRVCLRHAPKDGWQDSDVQRLAGEIERGLELLQALSPSAATQDHQDSASTEEAGPVVG